MLEKTLEQRVYFIEKVFWVVGVLAVIFGISGAWGLSILNNARTELSTLQVQVEQQRSNVSVVREKLIPIQEFVDKSKNQVELARTEIDRATRTAIAQVQPKIEESVDAVIRARTSPAAAVAATRNITSLGIHNQVSIKARRGDVIAASYSGSASSGEFYYKIVSPNNSAASISPESASIQVVQLSSEPWHSVSADQLFRATRDGEVKLAIEFSKSDVSGTVKVFGSTLLAYVVR